MISLVLLLFLVQNTPDWFLDWPEPATIEARRASSLITINGNLAESAWKQAAWSDPFVDITGAAEKTPYLETRTALLWNDTALFIAARMQEPHVWGTLLQRDTVIYYDNDFEFFFDPDGDNHRYGEIEINALNTVWDLLLEKPYRDRGPARTDWDLPGMQHAVAIEGTLNDPSDTDIGWTLELCIPWRDILDLSSSPLPPRPGDSWRINFSRVQWRTKDSAGMYQKLPGREDNWVWSPIGIVNMHVPERWGLLWFTESHSETRYQVDRGLEAARRAVMEGYHAQKKFRRIEKRWADTIEDLSSILHRPLNPHIVLERSAESWSVSMPYHSRDGSQRSVRVTHTGRLEVEKTE